MHGKAARAPSIPMVEDDADVGQAVAGALQGQPDRQVAAGASALP